MNANWAKAIAKALESSNFNNLRELDLCCNLIYVKGAKAIFKTLKFGNLKKLDGIKLK